MRAAPVIGVDVGGTTTDACLIADAVVGRASLPTGGIGGASIAAIAAAAAREAAKDGEFDLSQVAAVGVGIPGQVDIHSGTVRHAVNLGISGDPFPIGPTLASLLGMPAFVENDVRAAALGAFRHLRATSPDLHTLVYIGIGTGISSGTVVDGRLIRGRHGAAGEIGHIPVAAAGPPCRCGLAGCLEAVAAGPAIRRLWPQGAADLFERRASGDPEAVRVGNGLALALATAVRWLVASYDPDLVALGGGVGSATPRLAAAVAEAVRSLTQGSDFARQMSIEDRLTSLAPDLPVGALGAAWLARGALSESASPHGNTSLTGGDRQ